jgi:topoisomerase-4 subunit A
MKRFQLEVSDKTQFFLEEGAPHKMVAITYRKGASLEVIFGGNHAQRPQELVDVDEFIGIKSHRAKGKRITTYEVATLRFIEPELAEEAEADDELVEDGDVEQAIDAEDIVGGDLKADSDVDYKAMFEDEDGLAEQLDLF